MDSINYSMLTNNYTIQLILKKKKKYEEMFTAPTIFLTSLMTKILKFTCKFVILVYYQSLFNKY